MTDRVLAIRFPIEDVGRWASRYAYLDDDTGHIEQVIAPRCRARGYLDRPDFLFICDWKSQRQKARYRQNSAASIEEGTRIALTARDERLRIGVLRVLEGVGWPTASTLLHFAHQDPYPILDYRALWSLGVDEPLAYYTFPIWWDYVMSCRRIAESAGVPIRVLDQALWQYSKAHQTFGGLDGSEE